MSSIIRRTAESVVATTPELKRLYGKTLLLTGGTGFVGTWLLETLALLNEKGDAHCTVYVPTRDREAFARKAPHLASRPEFVFLDGDVTSFAYPADTCDFIIHAAAPASPKAPDADPIGVGDVIVEGARHVLRIAERHKLEGFLFVSSGAVYGPQPPDLELVPEDFLGGPDMSSPRSAYGEGKRYAEVLCAAYHRHRGVPVTIVRPFTFVGPYQSLDDGFAVTDFIREGLLGNPLVIKGDGTTVRSYAAPLDMVRALWAVLLRGEPGRAYNVGSDEPVSIHELARRVSATLDRPVEITVTQQPVPGRLPPRYVPSITRLTSELGVKPTVGLDEALRDTIEWARTAEHAVR